jgi:acyl phosphate:glycerol-3-phosphate acyltransferase
MSFAILAILLLVAYLLGSFPTGYLAGRLLKGIDIREEGSGSTGATNVLRTLGKGPGVVVLLTDVLKGFLAVKLVTLVAYLGWSIAFSMLPTTINQTALAMIGTAAMALLGHSKSVWLGGKGGKSVATGLGVLFALCWPVALLALGVFGVSIGVSRIVSISSISAALAVPVLMAVYQQPWEIVVFTAIGGGYVIWLHRANIQRLLASTEPRIGQKDNQETAAQAIEP